jgi:heat shock protein HslJ
MWRLIPLLVVLVACAPQDRVRPAFTTQDWTLRSINGTPFPGRVTMDIRPTGLVIGRTPCNRFGGFLSRWPVGWEFGPLGLQGDPCPDGHLEAAFIQALMQVTRSQVVGTELVLRGPDGLVLHFGRDRRPR